VKDESAASPFMKRENEGWGMMKPSSMTLGQIGIWTGAFERHPAGKTQEAAAELEQLGYGAVWYSEATGRESLTQAGLLLAATLRMVVATGIANIYGRDPFTMACGQKTLSEAYPNRFLLGLGVSHIPLVEQLRGHSYAKPVETMTAYLDAMDAARYDSFAPASTARVLAALGPKMLQLAAKRADGAHPYNVPPEHTAKARQLLGIGPLLCTEQAVVLETNPTKARQIARAFLKIYLTLPNYTNNFLRLGFTEEDCRNGGSDHLIDAIIAWGDLDAIRNRIRAHQSAGADHVCIQALTVDPKSLPLREWRELATALIERT
jgi:probable F420-dependent oxidoreductase